MYDNCLSYVAVFPYGCVAVYITYIILVCTLVLLRSSFYYSTSTPTCVARRLGVVDVHM